MIKGNGNKPPSLLTIGNNSVNKNSFNSNKEQKNWESIKENANFLAEEGKDTLEQVPEERGEKMQHEKECHPLPKKRKRETIGGSVWGEKVVVPKELFIYHDSKVVARRIRHTKIQSLRECKLIPKVVLWDILAEVI